MSRDFLVINSGKTGDFRAIFPLLCITGKSLVKPLVWLEKIAAEIQHNSGRKIKPRAAGENGAGMRAQWAANRLIGPCNAVRS